MKNDKTPKNKNIPERKCVVCTEMKPKSELLRVVRNKDGVFSVDVSGKADGRGAYICKNAECFSKCKKGKKLDKAFSCGIPEDIYTEIEKLIYGVVEK